MQNNFPASIVVSEKPVSNSWESAHSDVLFQYVSLGFLIVWFGSRPWDIDRFLLAPEMIPGGLLPGVS